MTRRLTRGRAALLAAAVAVVLAVPLLPPAARAPLAASPAQAAPAQTAATLTPATFADPPASVRPGTRWWWDNLGGTYPFDLADALDEVDAFAEAGFGRFEIAWRSDDYGTESQQGNLKAVAERAAEHGLQLDMTLGPGWPWSAPTTTGELGQQELMYGRTDVEGPTHFEEQAPPAIDDDEPRGTLEAVTAARVVERGPAVTEPGTPPASSTVLDPTSLVDLSDHVDADGTVTWDVPEGDWIVFSFWRRHREGNRVSLIDERSVRAGLKYVSDNQLGDAEPAVRDVGYSFFEDSLELNAEELYWTPDMFAEFTRRRGYDMTRYLPLMFVQGVSDYWVPEDEPVPDFELPEGEGARYRHDYYETITDLYIDDHMLVVGDWAQQYDMQFRTQAAYGNNFEVIRSAREAAERGVLVDDESLNAGDTPFLVGESTALPDAAYDEPDDPLWRFALDHYRQVVSGSHQGGGLEVTSELGAWFGLDLHTFLREYKRMMDKEWAMGVTRPLLHGVTHSPDSEPWPGAAHFLGIVGEAVNHRTWPEWQLLRPLSDYWARGALVLQQGKARTDVAVLRDSFVTTAAGPLEAPKSFFAAQPLEEAGFTIGYIDPVGLAEAPTGHDGALFPDGPSYDVLVVDTSLFYVDSGRLPGDAAEAIAAAAAKGLRVVFVGDPPTRGLGGADPEGEDRQVRQAIARVRALPTTRSVATQDEVGKALRDLDVRPAAEWAEPALVYSQRRDTADATTYLLWNARDEAVDLTGSFVADGAPVELDLWDGTWTPLATYRASGGRVTVPVHLDPHDVTVLHFPRGERRAHITSTTADQAVPATGTTVELRDAEGGAQTVTLADGSWLDVELPAVADEPIEVAGPATWSLQVDTYGPEGVVERPAMPLPVLADWREIPGLNSESGIGTYTATVTVPDGWVAPDRGVALDLGEFHGAVQISVNDTLATANVDPTAPVDITSLLQPGDNTLQVVLATTPFNKAVASSATTTATRPLWPASIAASKSTQPYGLLGPVRLVPSARGIVQTAPLGRRAGPEHACDPAFVPNPRFDDIAGGTHESNIRCVAWYGITQGAGGDRYLPRRSVTRAQMATFIAGLAVEGGLKLPSEAPDAFTDDDGSVHERNINALAALHLVDGKGGQRYDPGGRVTRAQMASFVARLHERAAGGVPESSRDAFDDDDASVHERSINALAALGVVVGTGGTQFRPERSLTRGQLASFVAGDLRLLVADGVAFPGGALVTLPTATATRGSALVADVHSHKRIRAVRYSGCGLDDTAAAAGDGGSFSAPVPDRAPIGTCRLAVTAATSRPPTGGRQRVAYTFTVDVSG